MLRRRPRPSKFIHGEPCWVELSRDGAGEALSFYEGLFGWSCDPTGGGDRVTFTSDGRAVAGTAPVMRPDQPSAWIAHLRVDDCDSTAAEAERWGGGVMVEPTDVGDEGRTAVLTDPSGAAVAVWQPGRRGGAELRNKPGSFCWIELATRDITATTAFYTALFGWEAATLDLGDQSSYTEWKLGGVPVAGMVEMGPEWPPEVPSHWMVYFAVQDCEQAAARVGELGGSVAVPCTDIPPGRFSVVSDPDGAVFSVIRLAVGG